MLVCFKLKRIQNKENERCEGLQFRLIGIYKSGENKFEKEEFKRDLISLASFPFESKKNSYFPLISIFILL